MMISAFARGAQVFDEPRYLHAASAAAEFIQARMYDAKTNLLKRRYRQGEADIDAVLEDYAFLIQGLLDLYEASFDTKWLSWAVRLQAQPGPAVLGRQRRRLFFDARGRVSHSRADEGRLRRRGAVGELGRGDESAASVAGDGSRELARQGRRHLSRARTAAAAIARVGAAARRHDQLPAVEAEADRHRGSARGAADTRAMLRLVHDRFIPNKILLLADGGPAQEQLADWLPFVGGMSRRDGRATIYVCENYACRLADERFADRRAPARRVAGQPAQIYVRERVKAGTALRGATFADRVVLFVHGAGTPAEVAFDVPYQDYSWMAYLARAGFDVFSMDTTGYGRSTRPAAMNDPCNLTSAQQSTFIPRLLAAPCAPSYPHQLTTIASDWEDIGAAIDYVRAARRSREPMPRVATWAGCGRPLRGATIPEKIQKLVLLAPAYNRTAPAGPPAKLPVEGVPMNTQSHDEFTANGIDRWAAPISTIQRSATPSGQRCSSPIRWARRGARACGARRRRRRGAGTRPRWHEHRFRR